RGNGRPLVAAMADDFRWIMMGTMNWSRSYQGKPAVLKELLEPLMAQFSDRYTNTAQHFIAEDDYVVVECSGRATTKNGQPYHNRYCYVCRLSDGKLKELREYLDTQLATAVLRP